MDQRRSVKLEGGAKGSEFGSFLYFVPMEW